MITNPFTGEQLTENGVLSSIGKAAKKLVSKAPKSSKWVETPVKSKILKPGTVGSIERTNSLKANFPGARKAVTQERWLNRTLDRKHARMKKIGGKPS